MAGPAGGRSPYAHPTDGHGFAQGQHQTPGSGKAHQHANLASGQWALTNSINSAGPVTGSSFSQHPVADDRPFSAEAQTSMPSNSQWQVPDMHAALPGLQYGKDNAACVLDTDQHEMSGLAPNDVLDFLGIGSADQSLQSDASQSERHNSQGLSSDGDTLQSPWPNI